ncbi:MAG: glycosyl transferase family 2 [Proteobacteria bacterium]|nr:glycosyl transferase family 2 [Pseudomonadota bacterium]
MNVTGETGATLTAPLAPVSVVIPCFRCTGTIERAVQSVVAQSLRPAEVILVDDCSGDDTLLALGRIARVHGTDWIKIVALPSNLGLASARNRGWEASTQAYVAFLDDDDAWHPDKIRLQYGYMRQHPEVTLTGHEHRIVTSGVAPNDPSTVPFPARQITPLALLLSNRFVAPSVMVKRDVPLRFLDGRRHMEDHLLWLRLALQGYRIEKLGVALAYIFKASYGESGLSAQMVPMARADLANYRELRLEGQISAPLAALLYVYSIAKSIRRFSLVALKRLHKWLAP